LRDERTVLSEADELILLAAQIRIVVHVPSLRLTLRARFPSKTSTCSSEQWDATAAARMYKGNLANALTDNALGRSLSLASVASCTRSGSKLRENLIASRKTSVFGMPTSENPNSRTTSRYSLRRRHSSIESDCNCLTF